ncbi:MAG TPA: leucine--tRNA ligase [Ktedonobacterales bacterium]|nr:leucine--tRNA ligase [Ktedonobacterales bacterium]
MVRTSARDNGKTTRGKPPATAAKPARRAYDVAAVEAKWRTEWERSGLYRTDLRGARKPYYNLMMFPYPSAEGLHVGNMYSYIGSDVHGRFQAMRGSDVFEPMGFDAFGIHSENFAIKQGAHPRPLTERNVARFRAQLRRIGNRFDWSREIQSTDPAYYRWTQWIFVRLFKAGLAERKRGAVNWCPNDKTVLADEQVIDGRCERCGAVVERRELEQWYFAITKYADRLLDNLDRLDWSARVVAAQRHWIGRSTGVEFRFTIPVAATEAEDFNRGGRRGEAESRGEKSEAVEIGGTVQGQEAGDARAVAPSPSPSFSTRSDSAASASSAVPSSDSSASGVEIAVFTTRPDTIYGVTFVVLSPEHPAVARVTDAAHREAVAAYVEQARRVRVRPEEIAERPVTGVFTGAYAVHPLTGARLPVWVADYVLMEYGTGAIMAVPAHDARDFAFARALGLPIRSVVVKDEETENDHRGHGGTRRQKAEEKNVSEGAAHANETQPSSTRSISPSSVVVNSSDAPLEEPDTGEGVLVGSGEYSGMASAVAGEAIARRLEALGIGRRTVKYHLRDWLISRQRYWGPPIPIIYCPEHGAVPVPEDQLPVLLPYVEDYRPTGTGVSPLAADPAFVHTTCPICGGPARRETDVSDNFLDSAWYFLRYPSHDDAEAPWDAAMTRKWLPVNMYVGGAEHSVLHLLYSRFITMALHDLEHLDFEEPFPHFRANGMITTNGAKISKSRPETYVSPDTYLDTVGADAFRTYLMFMGPYEGGGDFSDRGLGGVTRFLDRIWRFVTERASSAAKGEPAGAARRVLHATIRQVTDDTAAFKYNTAIAALMKYLNELETRPASVTRAEVRALVTLLAPFAPFIAEELWHALGGGGSVHAQPWPPVDEAALRAESVTLVVQVDGRMRDRITIAADASEEAIRAAALAAPNVARFVAGAAEVRGVVIVPGRLVNVVTGGA